ncbi:LacI family DNA-binding transcriptional regulator [Martelella radicis]|uniref:LacI family transcriptional regulator n=1 Tax=Martelella radicis TaxID=1397476 RepID=A0A7W6P9L5_9HYPH|nr:LacI family DNA-binding transcriptional regulator [Martelella radicis]MBB4121945.1 LacI family transcriptional regulator [Martelella radicis]
MDKPVRTNRVTIRTVAADAGVSVAAVSKVLRNAYGVSDALRENVMASIERLGYRPSTAARGMRGRTFTIGVLLINMENPFLPSLVAGFKRVMGKAGYNTLVGVGEARTHVETSLIESMIDMRIDGLLMIAPRISQDVLDTVARQVPVTVIGHHESAETAFDTVNSDDFAGGRKATEAMLARGYRDIAMLCLSARIEKEGQVWYEREKGYRSAMADAGLSDRARVVRVSEQPDNIYPDLRAMLERREEMPEAFFCWSDIHGVPLINLARKSGLKVPGDLGLVSYDNTASSALPLVELSSMDQKPQELGRIAADQLLTRIKGRTGTRHDLVTPELIIRSSF